MEILIGLVGVGALVLLGRGYYQFSKELADTLVSQEAGLKKSLQKGGDEQKRDFDLECGFEANHRLDDRELGKGRNNIDTHKAIGELL